MDQESNIYGTVVKKTVMEIMMDPSSCRHSADTIHYTKKPGQWSNVLLMSVAFLTLGGSLPIGYICGISTNPYHVEDSWVRLPMSTLRLVMLLGGLVGAAVSFILADWVGRRTTTLVGQWAGVVGAVSHLMATFSQTQTLFLFAWMSLGVFVGTGVSVLPLYLVELAPRPLRSSLGTVYSVGTSIGVMLSQTHGLHCALATGTGHPFLVPIFLLPVLLSWFIFSNIPESPIYLCFIKKDTSAAAAELLRLRGTNKASVEAELSSAEPQKYADASAAGRLLRQAVLTVVLCTAHISQALGESDQLYQLSGARPRLVESDVIVAGYTCSVINCVIALVLVQLITTTSWRALLVASGVTSSILLLVMAAFALHDDTSERTVYLMLVTLMVQVIVFDLGLRPIPCFLASELFNAKLSATMMAVGGAAHFLGRILSDYMFLSLGVAYFRFCAALFLTFFVVLLLATPSKRSVPSIKVVDTSSTHSKVSHLPNPHH